MFSVYENMDKVDCILKELPASVVSVYNFIKQNPGTCLGVIKDNTGYSIVSIKRFIRTLQCAKLVVIDYSENVYYADK